jgi:hypothetical protein
MPHNVKSYRAVAAVWASVLLVADCYGEQTSSPPAPIPAAEVKYRHQILANTRLNAFLLDIPPGHATLMHRHDRDILSVFLGGGRTTGTFEGREPVSDTLRSGEARFRSVGFTHATRNDDVLPFRSVILEFAQSQGARLEQLPPESKHCADRDQTVCTREKYEVCTAAFCAVEVWMPPGGILAKSMKGDSVLIPVSDCILAGVDGPDIAHTYSSGSIHYLGPEPHAQWENRGSTDAHLVLVIF